MSYEEIYCFYNGPFVGNANNYLIDSTTNQQIVFPANGILEDIWVQVNGAALTSGVSLTFGLDNNVESIIPSSASLTTDVLNTAPIHYLPWGLQQGQTSDHYVVCYPSADITGDIQCVIRWNYFTDI